MALGVPCVCTPPAVAPLILCGLPEAARKRIFVVLSELGTNNIEPQDLPKNEHGQAKRSKNSGTEKGRTIARFVLHGPFANGRGPLCAKRWLSLRLRHVSSKVVLIGFSSPFSGSVSCVGVLIRCEARRRRNASPRLLLRLTDSAKPTQRPEWPPMIPTVIHWNANRNTNHEHYQHETKQLLHTNKSQ